MSRFRSIEITDPFFPPVFTREISIFAPKSLVFPSFVEEERDFSFALDLLNPCPNPDPFQLFDTVTDLIQIERTPSLCSYKRIQKRAVPDFALQTLCDRVSALESKFDRLVSSRTCGVNRKYTWTAEIDGPVERKYKWTAEIKEGKKKKEDEEVVVVKKAPIGKKNYKWTAEIKGEKEDGGVSRTYTFKASSGDYANECTKLEKKEKKHKKKEKKEESETRVVEIEEGSPDHGVIVLRQAFAKRAGAIKNRKGKKKELSPQDAALTIQLTFRAYLIRRSKALRALRELAIAKTKLKEIRALFNNFSYRRRVSRDAEERQRFSEKIIVLLLTVDAIEGADVMVRAAKRSMVDELEAMLDVVDPQPLGKSLSMKRRTFDMPDSVIRKEIADGVAQVVQLLEGEENSAEYIGA
ncbi:BAG family molecular chaperone regulator 7 [Carica papaya]|uniref:BAG family molecular chaperone regulator 7 n=1 Tax=Carica papaya TaxID=3649 RepID=UPI000B8CAEA8|nr:BAG family molecular chaperone regulator 7 [Carica papaya]